MELDICDNKVRAGSKVAGIVSLTVPLEVYDSSMMIKISLNGWETSVVSMPQHNEREETLDPKFLLRKCSNSHLFFSKVTEFPMDEVTARKQVPVPFSFDIPVHLPGSMEVNPGCDPTENSILPSQARVQYIIQAEVLASNRCIKKDIEILGSHGDVDDQNVCFYAGASVPLNSQSYFCGIFSKKKSEAIKLISSHHPICLSRGEVFRCVLPALGFSMSFKNADALKVEIFEQARWRARNRTRERFKNWSPSVYFPDDDENNYDNNASAAAMLIDIPAELAPSYFGDAFEVSHEMILAVRNDVTGILAVTNKIPLHVV